DPDQVKSPRRKQAMDSPPVCGSDVEQFLPFARKHPLEILVVKKRGRDHLETGTLKRRQKVVVPNATARSVALVSSQQQDRVAHSTTRPDASQQVRHTATE